MLVLTRGRNDKIVFPTLGISLEIVRVAGKRVQIGIDAPEEVPVHRHEVAARIDAGDDDGHLQGQAIKTARPRRLNQAARARLDAAALGLNRLHCMLESGDLSEAEATIFNVFCELKAIDHQVDGNRDARSRGEREQIVGGSSSLQADFHNQCLSM